VESAIGKKLDRNGTKEEWSWERCWWGQVSRKDAKKVRGQKNVKPFFLVGAVE
jgi:hypothetical protein